MTMALIASISETENLKSKNGTTVIYYGRIPSCDKSRAEGSVLGVKTEILADPQEAPPKLKLEGQNSLYVDIIVRNAVSPVNFMIQSYRQSKYLHQLETQMTSYYESSSSNKNPLAFNDLILQGYYAVKYPRHNADTKIFQDEIVEHRWVRCQIMKPFNQNMPILTYLIDHGVYHMTEPNCTQLLKKEYVKLPAQAYEAKLHFIKKPHHFTPEDCQRFHSEVEGKSFVGIITNSNENDKDKIGIILIDTSQKDGKDVYVHQNYRTKKIQAYFKIVKNPNF